LLFFILKELNKQILENRRIYAELEARLLAGETVRIHRYQGEVNKYQEKWREATYNVHKQKWMYELFCIVFGLSLILIVFRLNLSEVEANFEATIRKSCESLGSDLSSLIQTFVTHINTLK